MIRPFQPKDMNPVLKIWLAASLAAHDFIPSEFWESKVEDMRKLYLPNSEILVHEDGGEVDGFLALHGNTVAALFVSPPRQHMGVGTQLLQKAKGLRDTLQLTVYTENRNSVRFYEQHGFHAEEERRDAHTGHTELLMTFPGRHLGTASRIVQACVSLHPNNEN